ncbi:MAG TPA: hypothetical protein VLX90_13820 [Steroidobacteraceae bacterium]|nr:hypothetical protein [Steroidobacteraceae bacterium]
MRTRAATGDSDGTLLVYSATRVTTSDDSEYPVHTPYTIYGRSEQVVRRIENTSGLFSKDPQTVSLKPGEYRIKALAAGAGYVVIPVIIESQRTTVVDLDGSALPQGSRSCRNGDGGAGWVRLPDGHVVGSPAVSGSEPRRD